MDDIGNAAEQEPRTTGATGAAPAHEPSDSGHTGEERHADPAGLPAETATKAVGAPSDIRDTLEFDLRRRAVFHNLRADFFSRMHTVLTLVVVISGTGAALQFVAGDTPEGLDLKLLVPLAAAIAGVIDLVIRPSARHYEHSSSANRYMEVLSAVENTPAPTAEQQAELNRRRDVVMRTSSGGYRPVVDRVAYNYVCAHYRLEHGAFLKVFFLKRWLKHFL